MGKHTREVQYTPRTLERQFEAPLKRIGFELITRRK